MAYEELPNRLEQLMKDAGYTRSELCLAVWNRYGRDVQVTHQDLSKYLSGETLPRMDKVAAIAEVCGASHSQIALLVRSALNRTKD